MALDSLYQALSPQDYTRYWQIVHINLGVRISLYHLKRIRGPVGFQNTGVSLLGGSDPLRVWCNEYVNFDVDSKLLPLWEHSVLSYWLRLQAIISNVTKEDMAVATGITYLFRTTGQVLGVSLSGALLQTVLTTQLRKRITGPNAFEVRSTPS